MLNVSAKGNYDILSNSTIKNDKGEEKEMIMIDKDEQIEG